MLKFIILVLSALAHLVFYDVILVTFFPCFVFVLKNIEFEQSPQSLCLHCTTWCCISCYQLSSWFRLCAAKVLSFFHPKIFLSTLVLMFWLEYFYISQLFNCYKRSIFTECMLIVTEIFTCFCGLWIFCVFTMIFQSDLGVLHYSHKK